jgi:hypothetical protein
MSEDDLNEPTEGEVSEDTEDEEDDAEFAGDFSEDDAI